MLPWCINNKNHLCFNCTFNVSYSPVRLQSHIDDATCMTVISDVSSLLFNGSPLSTVADALGSLNDAIFSTKMVLLPLMYQSCWCLVVILNLPTVSHTLEGDCNCNDALPMMLMLHPDKDQIKHDHYVISEKIRSLLNCLWLRRYNSTSMKPFTAKSMPFHVLDGE